MTIVNKAAMTQDSSKPVKGHSRFPLNQRIAGGFRFGHYQPCYGERYNPNETIPVKSAHDVRSVNLKSPMLGNVSLHKDYFDIPYSVLLPLNYEKWAVQPTRGDDVDAAEVGLNVHNLPYILSLIIANFKAQSSALLEEISTAFADSGTYSRSDLAKFLDSQVKFINTLSLTFSSGSLFSIFGEDISALVSRVDVADETFDYIDLAIDELWNLFFKELDTIMEELSLNSLYVGFDNQSYIYKSSASDSDPHFISKHRFVELSYDASNTDYLDPDQYDSLDYDPSLLFEDIASETSISYSSVQALQKDLQLDLIFAYQVVCAEFYTNSRVDYMFTGQLFRQFVSAYYDVLGISRDNFTWNGVDYQYDFLSAHLISYALTLISNLGFDEDVFDHYQFLRLLFGFNRSLRYVDYFTGARPQPYPVNAITVPVSDGSVSVVDSIHQNWWAKFVNQAFRLGRKLSEYAKGMYPDVKIERDYHDAMWLGSIHDMIDTPETQNTGAAQITPTSGSRGNSTTSNFVSNGTRYAFDYETPQYLGVVIGIMHFDIARYYSHVIERNNFNVDRNDFFNPYLQLIGDQPIYQDELYSGSEHSTFGYTGRDMQYKQKVDRCFGVFTLGDYLPGWLYVAPDAEPIRGNLVQNPSYIRAYPSELNKFYSAMPGYSPATWFHFIVVNTNDCNISRPMIANPSLD